MLLFSFPQNEDNQLGACLAFSKANKDFLSSSEWVAKVHVIFTLNIVFARKLVLSAYDQLITSL